MCIIVPIDHVPCTHTVATWHHCANAPRSVLGHKPCSHIRQHGRPIITRKLCHNCGGPRFFARRGGIAARGSGSPVLDQAQEQKEEQSHLGGSGYQNDVIPEVEEEDDNDPSLSPLQPAALTRKWSLSTVPRSSGQKSNWRPNLKRDLNEVSSVSSIPSSRPLSLESALPNFDGRNTHYLPSSESDQLDRPSTPIIRPSARRKGSTLLHPSPPPTELEKDSRRSSTMSIQDLTPPATPPHHSALPTRLNFSSLHPSFTERRNVSGKSNFPDHGGFTLASSLLASITNSPTSAPLTQQRNPFRKNSTLLHPSPPNDDPIPSPLPTKTFFSLPPTPLATPTFACFKRCPSENEWEDPLHSSHSDAEYDSDASANTEPALAHRGRALRKSRTSFHGNSNNALRTLQD